MQDKGSTLLIENEITLSVVERIMRRLGVNPNVVSPERLLAGILVELEHDGRMGQLTDVTRGDLIETTKIALAHFAENPGDGDKFPDYYALLQAYVEVPSENYWNARTLPSVFLK